MDFEVSDANQNAFSLSFYCAILVENKIFVNILYFLLAFNYLLWIYNFIVYIADILFIPMLYLSLSVVDVRYYTHLSNIKAIYYRNSYIPLPITL